MKEDKTEYNRKNAIAKGEVSNGHRETWVRSDSVLETDIPKPNLMVYKVLNSLNHDRRENIRIDVIDEGTWLAYFQN
jgi:hypothetical protein